MELNQILNDMAAGTSPASDNCDYGCSCGPDNYGYYPNCGSTPATAGTPALQGMFGNNNMLLILMLLLLSGNNFGGLLGGKGNNQWSMLILILLLSNR